MENIEKNKAINILIPKLIDKTENLQKEIKSRLLLNKIFSEFENKASDQLNYFITNSIKRYNCTKLGNNLYTFLTNAEKENKVEVNKIIHSPLYKDLDLYTERKKMKYKSTTKLFKDINETFDKIKYPLDSKFSRNNKRKIRKIIRDNENEGKRTKRIIRNIEVKKITPIKRNIIKFYNKEFFNNDTNIINSEFNKEQNLINNSVKEYLNNVNSKVSKENYNNLSPVFLLNSLPYSNKPKINFPKLKLLNYNQLKPVVKKSNQKDANKSPDIRKILPYYKLFKAKKFEKDINRDESEHSKIPFITEADIKINKRYKFNNTQDIVYDYANKELKKDKNLNDSRKKLDELIGSNDMPQIRDYYDIILNNSRMAKMERFNKNKKYNKSEGNVLFVIRKKYNEIINNELKKLDKIENKLLSKSNMKKTNYKEDIK